MCEWLHTQHTFLPFIGLSVFSACGKFIYLFIQLAVHLKTLTKAARCEAVQTLPLSVQQSVTVTGTVILRNHVLG